MTSLPNIREHCEARRERAASLFRLDANNIPNDIGRLISAAQKTARRFAWCELLRYSAAHPRRRCELRMGMGDVTLHVEYGGYIPGEGPWVFNEKGETSSYRRGMRAPEFLAKLQDLGEALGLNRYDGAWFVYGVWVAHHGVMLEGELS